MIVIIWRVQTRTGCELEETIEHETDFRAAGWRIAGGGVRLRAGLSCKTHPYQPRCDTEIVNLKLAGSHTKTDADLWSMEGACESGRRAAFSVASKYGECTVEVKNQRTPLMIRLFWKLDNALWACGLPNLIDVILFVSLLIILLVPTIVVLSAKK